MSLFPMIQPQSVEKSAELKLYKEVKWDYENNRPFMQNGSPIVVYGKEALHVWIWKTLHTVRYRYEIYTWDYGCEVESLIGQPFSEELKQAEAERYVKECLVVNQYVTDVDNVTVNLVDDMLSISCNVSTVYGEAKIYV